MKQGSVSPIICLAMNLKALSFHFENKFGQCESYPNKRKIILKSLIISSA